MRLRTVHGHAAILVVFLAIPVASLLLGTAATGQPQPPGGLTDLGPSTIALPPAGVVPSVSPVLPVIRLPEVNLTPAPQGHAPSPPPSVERLLDQLTELRQKKAELDSQEQKLTATLRERLKNQRERLTKLGIAPDVEIAPPPVEVENEILRKKRSVPGQ